MRVIFIISALIFGVCCVKAQQIEAKVVVNAQKINQTNENVFKELENALKDFINQTQWDLFSTQPKMIPCQFIFTINDYDSGNFSANLQVQASRPVYNSVYTTSMLNVKDSDVEFSYQPFETLRYTPGIFDSNLSAIVAFYVNIILGLDADSFSKGAGKPYYTQAQQLTLLAQGSSYSGWDNNGRINRWQMADDFNSVESDFSEIWYLYHRKGLDMMASYPEKAKENIAQALISLSEQSSIRINSSLFQLFFDAKENEIIEIFSAGVPIKNIDVLKEALNKISPSFSMQWNNIR